MKRGLTSHLRFEEITDFLEAKIPVDKLACPRCGTDQWRVVGDHSEGEIFGIPLVDGGQEQVGLYAAVVLSCMNCGFIAMHAKQTIVDWLDEVGR